MEIRSFLAFELPPEMRDIITGVSEEARKSTVDAKWVKAGNIHLTIVFMGHINRDLIPAVNSEVERICLAHDPFEIRLKGMGVFPNRRKPRVLWLGLDGEIERMSRLREGLQTVLNPFGIKQEKRAFKPHLTLGRFKKYSRTGPGLDELMARYQAVTSPSCTLKELILFQSDLKPGGAVYTKLAACRLGAIKIDN